MSFSYPCVGCDRSTDHRLQFPFNQISMCVICQAQLAKRQIDMRPLLGEWVRK